MDLNNILTLWPYAAVVAGVPAIFYAKPLFGWAKSKLGFAAEPATPVGTLAEYLKAISVHCEKAGETEALAACDKIAPALFHEKKNPAPANAT